MVERYQLRSASLADVAELAALEAASFPDPWTPAQLATALGDETVSATVAVSPNGEIIGYIIARTIADEGEVLSVTSAPGHRRRGIGRRLLDDALATMRRLGARTAWLEVRRSNEAAQAMYASAGFVATGTRRAYYQAPREDALVLRCDLTLSALPRPAAQ